MSTSTCYRMAHAGRLPVIHRRGGMFVPAAALAAFLAAEADAALDNLKNDDGPAGNGAEVTTSAGQGRHDEP